jgi:hypothetical protein
MDFVLTIILVVLEVIAVGIIGFKFTYDVADGIDILNKHSYNQKENYMKDEDEKDE